MHTDKFGRQWGFKPGNNPDHMLQIPRDLAKLAVNLQRLARGFAPDGLHNLESYLLKVGSQWYFGARWGDHPHEYYSPGLDDALIALLIKAHQHNATDPRELAALKELT